MLQETVKAASCVENLKDFSNKDQKIKGKILTFKGVDNSLVYNPSIPFLSDGMKIIVGRVESKETHRSKAVFFTEVVEGVWKVVEGAPEYTLEDPFVTEINSEIIFGGVQVEWLVDGKAIWKTVFYRGKSIYSLNYFAEGPEHMKDVRVCGLPDGRVAVLSRPQGEKMQKQFGCIAKIGFTVLPSLDALTAEAIGNASLLEGHFLPEEWGGANQAYLLSNGLIGVIGHKAYGEMIDGVHFLHYHSMAFAIDPKTRKMSEVKVIANRSCFPEGESKANHPRLADVTFTAGIIRKDNGEAELYTGLSDSQIGCAIIPDPLLEYEQM